MPFRLSSRGLTLVELLVVLAVLGIMAALVGLAWRTPQRNVDEGPLLRARQRAIQSGVPTRFQVVVNADTVTAVALPDGSVVGPDVLPIDPLAGVPNHASGRP